MSLVEAPAPPAPNPVPVFEAFYAANSDRVYRALAITLGDSDLAREATDEAMARAFARWPRVAELDNPGGWTYRVGLNWATSRWRRRRRERPLPDDLDPPGPATDVDTGIALAALRQLGTAGRAVVVCRVLLELSTTETAAILGIADGTVKSRLSRALTALRAALSEETPR